MNLVNNKKIAIAGAGPGGLTLARLLQLRGADVQVYERDRDRDTRVQGGTLDLHEESGLKALEAAGLTDAFRNNYRPGADHMRIVDQHARILQDEDTTGGHTESRPEIDRGPLRNLLLDALEPGTVHWDHQLVNMKPEAEGWSLEFANGNSVYADIVIGADGANSRIRPLITRIRAVYSGITIVEGSVPDSAATVPALHELLAGGKVFGLGDGNTIIVSSKGDGSLVFYTGCRTAEHWAKDSGIDFGDRDQVQEWFTTTFGSWDPLWQELVAKATLPLAIRPQYCMPADQHWETLPNLSMLGDAAHLMPPYAGEGVNMAMLDALELSNALCDPRHPDIQSALQSYELQMRERAAEMIQMTMEQTEALHSPGAAAHMLAMFGE